MNPRVGTHCCGSAIDVSVFTLDESAEIRQGRLRTWRCRKRPPWARRSSPSRPHGTGLRSQPSWPGDGFRTYHFEFWHYNKADAYDEHLSGSGRPARYGPVDFDPATGKAHADRTAHEVR